MNIKIHQLLTPSSDPAGASSLDSLGTFVLQTPWDCPR